MSEQFKEALARSLILGGIAALTATAAYFAADPKWAPLGAIIGAFTTRFAIEGKYDTVRNNNGDVHPADVGSGV